MADSAPGFALSGGGLIGTDQPMFQREQCRARPGGHARLAAQAPDVVITGFRRDSQPPRDLLSSPPRPAARQSAAVPRTCCRGDSRSRRSAHHATRPGAPVAAARPRRQDGGGHPGHDDDPAKPDGEAPQGGVKAVHGGSPRISGGTVSGWKLPLTMQRSVEPSVSTSLTPAARRTWRPGAAPTKLTSTRRTGSPSPMSRR
jgi:hypothetical protein